MYTDTLIICETKEETALKLAEVFTDLADDSDQVLNIALSGGSTPKILFQILSEKFKDSTDFNRFRYFWVDERCVPKDHADSNYGMAKANLFNIVDVNKENIFRVRGEDNPVEEAQRYSQIINSLLPSKNGLPQFDLILLGMGDDGHTASIFPNQFDLLKSDKNCDVAFHPDTGQKRVTLTGKVINNAKRNFFLVTGKSKAKVVTDIFNNIDDFTKYPAAHITHAVWFLDNDAASGL